MKISSTQRPNRCSPAFVALSSNQKPEANALEDSYQETARSTLSELLVPTPRKLGSAAVGGLSMAALAGGGYVLGQMTHPLVGTAVMAAGMAGGFALSASKNNHARPKTAAFGGLVAGLQLAAMTNEGASPLAPVAFYVGSSALAGYAKPNLFLPSSGKRAG